MISVEQYRRAIGGFTGGRAGREWPKNDIFDFNNARRYRDTTDTLNYDFLIYICYTVLISALLGIMLRSTPPPYTSKNDELIEPVDLNSQFIWYANCILFLFFIKGMSSDRYTYI